MSLATDIADAIGVALRKNGFGYDSGAWVEAGTDMEIAGGAYAHGISVRFVATKDAPVIPTTAKVKP